MSIYNHRMDGKSQRRLLTSNKINCNHYMGVLFVTILFLSTIDARPIETVKDL